MASQRRNGTGAAAVDGGADPDLCEIALTFLAGGVSLVPCSPRTKQPAADLLPKDEAGKPTWKPYQNNPATAATVKGWFDRGCKSVAAIGGNVSGGLLIIDFDVARFYEAWKVQVGHLADGLPVQRTGREGGGYQVCLRCPEPGGNDKLAWVPDDTETTGRKCAVETRGEGGYAVMPGSLHPSGRRYEAISGDFAAIPAVSQAVADALLQAARNLDEAPLTRQKMEAREKAAKTSDRHRAESNGQGSIIDAYNQQTSIETALESHSYERHGDRWKRPGGKSLSVYVKGDRSFHHSSSDPLNDGYWHRPFDVFCELEHGGDCKAAVKAAAELLGMKPSDSRHDAPDQAAGDGKERFPLVTCATLDAEDYTPRSIITDCLYAGHPAITGGMFKTLKSLISVDAAISIASGKPFLNHFTVAAPLTVVYFTGEGGPSMMQEYGRRVAASKGLRLSDVRNLYLCFTIPKLESLNDLDAIQRLHDDTAAEVMVFDNLMLALSGDEAGNVFKMGQILGNVIRICNERGITPIFIHHFKRNRTDQYAPGDLVDLTQAGAAEIAGQWWFLTRREIFNPNNPGEHRLSLNIGGRLGHGCLHALDIHEGRLSDPGGRFWKVEVLRPDDVQRETDDQKAEANRQRKEERAAADLERDRKELVKVVARLKKPESKTAIRARANLGNGQRFERAWASLVDDETFEGIEITKGKNPHVFVWKLRKTANP